MWKFLVLFVCLFSNGYTLRRDSNIVYFDDGIPQSRQSTSVLSDIATEIIRRSSGSSQILNLNLSNLLLILVLKAIVYGAGYIGNNETLKGRGDDPVENTYISEGEAALALGYLIGDTCLYRAACEVPQTAKHYLGAAEMIFQTMKLLPISTETGDSFANKMLEFQKAIDHGLKDQCPVHYNCKKDNIHRFLRPQ